MANSPNLGYSVGSWKELACTWSDSCPGKTRDSACPGPVELWSTETLWDPLLWSGKLTVITVQRTHETENRQQDTQQCSAVCSETSLTLTSGFRVIPGSSLPCYRPAGPPAWAVGMCRRASLSIGVDTMPLSPSLRKNSSALWCQLWKTLKVPNCNGKPLFIFPCYAVLSELMFIDKHFFVFSIFDVFNVHQWAPIKSIKGV